MISVTFFFITVSITLQCFAIIIGIFSLALPVWVLAENKDSEQVVRMSRRLNTGPWLQRVTFDPIDTTISHSRWDELWIIVQGTTLDELKAIKGTMVCGMFFQFLTIFSCFAVCCWSKKKYSHLFSKILCLTVVSTLLSVILLLNGPVVYSTTTVTDYKYRKKQLDARFWMAVVSTLTSFFAFILSIWTGYHFCRQERIKRKTDESNNGMSVSYVTRY